MILTSKGFGNDIATEKIRNNLNINIDDAKVLFVPTALGGLYSYDKYLPEIIKFGFKESNIIIFNEKESSKYENLDIDVIYVCGGNTFTLLKLIKECGFDKALKNYIQKGVIYIGRSAGTHLVTKNIEHILNFDDNYIGLTDYEGIGIFDGVIFCHYTEEREKFYKETKNNKKYNTYKITDEEIIICTEKIIKK